jgi:hypothetical protein
VRPFSAAVCGEPGDISSGCCHDANLPRSQLGSQRWQTIIFSVRPTIFDRTLDVSGLVEAKPESCDVTRRLARRPAAEESDDRHSRLLRARRKRPRSRSAADERDELAPPIKKTRSHRTIAKRVGLAQKAEAGQGLTVFILQGRPPKAGA